MSTTLAPKIKLNNGQEIPVIGLGTWRSRESEAEQAVKDAIEAGYRHIDTAFVYENECEVGVAIRTLINDGIVQREDLFIVTKLSGSFHDPKMVEEGCRRSLLNLALDYVDLFLMHFPVGQTYVSDKNTSSSGELSDVDYLHTWQAMEDLVDKGLVRGIGLSNFNAEQTDRILQNCRIRPLVNQVECHPGFNQKELIQFSRDRDIIITAYCPLARPNAQEKWPPFLYEHKAEQLAKQYGKTTAQVCLRYLIQLGVVVIPKSVSRERIRQNFDIFDFKLSQEDMEIMDSYNTGKRIIPFNHMKNHKYYPFNNEF